jgi:predicted transcriptional regulator
MTSEDVPKIVLTDPKMMRALAHPMRMALLELIEVTGTLTATQASEALGESPANCAFHLRTLGKYGYIAEAGGGKGRERPWKRVDMRIDLSADHDEPSTNLTAKALQQLMLDHLVARVRKVLLNIDDLPKEWRDATRAMEDLVFLTADELREVSEQVVELTDRFRDRKADSSSRPEGALPVQLLFFGYPLIDLAALAAATASADDVPPADEQ